MFDVANIEALGRLLAYGAIGLGLAVAILASILLIPRGQTADEISGKVKFMVFGFALVLIGAGLEAFRILEAERRADRVFIASQNLPDEFWQDFMIARQQKLFGTAEPTDEFASGSLMVNETKERSVYLPPDQCRFYFAAAKPPAKINVTVEPKGVEHRLMYDKEYYKTGKICSTTQLNEPAAKLLLTMTDARSQYSVALFVAPSETKRVATGAVIIPGPGGGDVGPQGGGAAEKTSPRRVVCVGEYEPNCAGAHDVFMGCGSGSDSEIGTNLCLPATLQSAKRLHTKGGNRCGYSLIEVTCL
jgi:hypothetical protein